MFCHFWKPGYVASTYFKVLYTWNKLNCKAGIEGPFNNVLCVLNRKRAPDVYDIWFLQQQVHVCTILDWLVVQFKLPGQAIFLHIILKWSLITIQPEPKEDYIQDRNVLLHTCLINVEYCNMDANLIVCPVHEAAFRSDNLPIKSNTQPGCYITVMHAIIPSTTNFYEGNNSQWGLITFVLLTAPCPAHMVHNTWCNVSLSIYPWHPSLNTGFISALKSKMIIISPAAGSKRILFVIPISCYTLAPEAER